MIEDTITSSIKFLEETKRNLDKLKTELCGIENNIEYENIISDEEREVTSSDLIRVIERFAYQHPDYEIVIDAPDSANRTMCKDITFVYEGEGNAIVLNAE